MNKTFQWCVDILVYLAAKLHITYEAINIWIFVIIEPIVFFILIAVIYKQWTTIRVLRHALMNSWMRPAWLQPEERLFVPALFMLFYNPFFAGNCKDTCNSIEESIITTLQNFLIEMGRGFCFEARQKRKTFDNKHRRIDLAFYHRILKCHFFLDLILGEFDHSDSGQMNMYLNYYKDNEFTKGDKDPIVIILCSGKMRHWWNMPQWVCRSKYLFHSI